MKSTAKLLLLLSVIIYSLPSQASHDVGGTIYWKCVDNGKFQFYLERYRDCKGIPIGNFDETITISGSSLPTDDNNATLSSITMKFLERKDLSPRCATNGSQFSCADNDFGAIEQITYRSDTLVLKGKPPRSGWSFSWNPACCRGSYQNVLIGTGSGSTLLRSFMYSYGQNKVDSCYDSSPEFAAAPTVIGCRGTAINYLNTAKDADFDELRYSWDKGYNGTAAAPVAITYANGYSAQSPTPGTGKDTNNVPANINANTGKVNLEVHNGVGFASFLKVVRVDAYRRGVKIASIFKDQPFFIMDCNQLADSTDNNAPKIYLDSIERNSIKVSVTAGKKLSLPIKITDLDTAVRSPQLILQGIKLSAISDQLAFDWTNDTNCLGSNLSPCATFSNLIPEYDTFLLPHQFSATDTTELSTNLEWEPTCDHLNDDGSAKTYFFFLKAQDDHCSVPGTNVATIEVEVVPDSSLCGLTTYIQEVSLKEQVSVYPNPTSGEIKVTSQGTSQKLHIQVRNIHGQLVQEQQFINQKQLELELQGEDGIYFLQLSNEKGERANLKMVKQ